MRKVSVVCAGLIALVAAVLPLPVLAAERSLIGCTHALRDAPTRATGPAADPTAWLGRCGHRFYVEPAQAVTAQTVTDPITSPTSAVPAEQAFTLHSRPGSTRVLFLDFDGHLLSGTGWNDDFTGGADLSAAPYDTDGTPAAFSAAERAAVIAVFQRVAEDFAPFDLDVTTADPGPAAIDRSGFGDTAFGTRALVTNTSLSCGGCAGIAYLSVFDSPYQHSYTQPALAFSSALGGSAKLIAEVVSHEVGHNLGLEHDGTLTSGYSSGHGAWSPIMGAATSRPISQWSNGDYLDADNHEDDLAVMAAHGAPLLTDDHGDTAATATALTESATGLIGTRTDTDWFSFTTSGGPVSVTATPTAIGSNLDLSVDLLGGAGAVLAGSDPLSSLSYADPPTGLASSLALTDLAAGSYLLRVDGVGAGNPLLTGYSDYGSLGRYTLTLNAPAVGLPLSAPVAALPEGTVGAPWSRVLQASGGQAPYQWSVATGVLPPGLTLAADGTLSGTPTSVGSFPFATLVEDGTSSVLTVWTLTVRVAPAVTTSSLPATTKGRPYAVSLTALGGLPPYTWVRTAGTLPSGITLSSTGRLAGTPTASGTFSTAVRVTDAVGRTANRTLSLRVNVPPVVATITLPTGRKAASYATRIAVTGGTPAAVWRLYAGTLPTGMRFTSTGVLSGVPSVRTTRNLTFQVTDGRGAVARRTLRLVIG